MIAIVGILWELLLIVEDFILWVNHRVRKNNLQHTVCSESNLGAMYTEPTLFIHVDEFEHISDI